MSGVSAQERKKHSYVDPATFTPHFSWKKSVSKPDGSKLKWGAALLRPYAVPHVHCEDVSLNEIAETAGTPTYVYSKAAIGDAYNELVSGLGALPHTLCFAVKSNGNLAILKYLAGLGSGFDIVSGGELQHLQRLPGTPMRCKCCSSPPETISNPLPKPARYFRIARLPFDFTAKQSVCGKAPSPLTSSL